MSQENYGSHASSVTVRPIEWESLPQGQLADVIAAAEEYMAALQRGEVPDRQAFLAAHPDIAQPLAGCLNNLELLQHGGAQLRLAQGGPEPDGSQPEAIGDYRILREIGRGGMGIVYEAEQLSLARKVALKVLPFAGMLDQRQLARFKTEAQAAAQLHHTNIVPVFAVGCDRGVHYYAMQYIEGQTLSAIIHELRRQERHDQPGKEAPSDPSARASPSELLLQITGSLSSDNWGSSPAPAPPTPPVQPSPAPSAPTSPPATSLAKEIVHGGSTHTHDFFRSAARLGIQAAEALEHAHLHGVIHRDINPSNLMVDTTGNLWITDFGLAIFRHESQERTLTMPGDLLGTLRYMSPEQALAKRVPVDHHTDIYSLGVTLYELLALHPAFDGHDRHELLKQVAEQRPEALHKRNPRIPADLETIIAKAMAKEPQERYATAQQMADDLRRFLSDTPILARRPTLLHRSGKWCRRHQAVVCSALAMVMLAIAGLSISSALLWTAHRQSQASEQRAERERGRAERNLGLAMDALDTMYARLSEVSEPTGYIDQRLLEPGLRFNDQVVAENQGSVLALERAAQSLATRSKSYGGVHDRAQTLQMAHQEVALRRQVLAVSGQNTDRNRQALAEALIRSVIAGVRVGDPNVDRARSEALAIARDLEAKYPDDPRVLNFLAEAEPELALGTPFQGGVGARRRAIQIYERLSSPPYNQNHRGGLGWNYMYLSTALIELGRWPEAEQAARQSITQYESLRSDNPRSLGVRQWVCEARGYLVDALRSQDRYDEAQRELETLLPECEQLAAALPNDWVVAWTAGKAAGELAAIHTRFGRLEQAAAAHERERQAYASVVARWPATTEVHARGQVQWCTSTCALADVLGQIPGRQAGAAGLYREALAASDPLMRQEQPIQNLMYARCWAYFGLSDLVPAIHELERYSRRFPQDFQTRYRHAIACLGAGDREGYRAACQDALAHWDLAKEANGGPRMVWTCLLLPDSGIDVADLAEKAKPLLSPESRDAEVLRARAMLLYRTGRYEALVRQWPDRGQAPRELLVPYVLAMSHHRLGQAAEAREWLMLADELVDRSCAGMRQLLGYGDRVSIDLLRQEAEGLIGPTRRPSTAAVAEASAAVAPAAAAAP